MLGVLLTVTFLPLYANLWSDQVNLVVLVLVAAGLAAYALGDRWWGGVALNRYGNPGVVTVPSVGCS